MTILVGQLRQTRCRSGRSIYEALSFTVLSDRKDVTHVMPYQQQLLELGRIGVSYMLRPTRRVLLLWAELVSLLAQSTSFERRTGSTQIISGDTIGLGGYLTGGHSPLSAMLGLAVDQVLEMEVVMPCGKTVVANQVSNIDLFWAMRGVSNCPDSVSCLLTLHPGRRCHVRDHDRGDTQDLRRHACCIGCRSYCCATRFGSILERHDLHRLPVTPAPRVGSHGLLLYSSGVSICKCAR